MKYYIENELDTEENIVVVIQYILDGIIPHMIVDVIERNTITVFSKDGIMATVELESRFTELHLDYELETNISTQNSKSKLTKKTHH